MTLIAAAVTPDGTWMAGERLVGGDDYRTIAGPKVFKLWAGDTPFSIGFAGSPRVAQLALSVDPPPFDPTEHSHHWWFTEFCNRIGARCADMWALPNDSDGVRLPGYSGALVCIDGHTAKIGNDLSWEEPARGWHSIGVAFETHMGAWSTLISQGVDVIEAAIDAWPIAEQFHRVGTLTDTIVL